MKYVILGLSWGWTLISLAQGTAHQDQRATHREENISEHAPHAGGHHGPASIKTEFENEFVQVVRISIAPHEKIPMHDVTPRAVVLLTDQDLKITFPNGETREEHHKAGETMWLSGQRHSGENLSDNPIEFIAIIPR
jgi:quercetin dioxygenase-like cupin family protein